MVLRVFFALTLFLAVIAFLGVRTPKAVLTADGIDQ
jgi:hypothetical protein